MSRSIVLWRHGLTDWNADGLVQGQSDIPLNDVGRRQAAEAGARLASLVPVRIVSSDLSRARATAQALADLTGVEVETDPRLREMDFGQREGLTFAESRERFPEQMAAFRRGEDLRFPDAETYAEAADRFASALTEIADAAADGTTVVVAHGGVLRVGICRFLGFPPEVWNRMGGFNNCAWAVLQDTFRGWRLAEWNAGTLPEPVLSDDA